MSHLDCLCNWLNILQFWNYENRTTECFRFRQEVNRTHKADWSCNLTGHSYKVGAETLNLLFLFPQRMGDSSDDDEAVPQLVAMETGKVPITIITGFLGKYFASHTCNEFNII